MKALTLASSPSWWIKGRRKVRASLALQTLLLLFMLLAMFGPLLNLLIWTVAESWYFPHSLPSQWGLKYWYQVFNPYSDVSGSLLTSVLIALLSVGGLFADFRPRRLCAFPAENAAAGAVYAAVSHPAGLSQPDGIHECCPIVLSVGIERQYSRGGTGA